MKKQTNPIVFIVFGAILALLGTFLPNGIILLNYAELIGIYNLFVTLAQGAGIGMIIGGIALLITGKFKKEPDKEKD